MPKHGFLECIVRAGFASDILNDLCHRSTCQIIDSDEDVSISQSRRIDRSDSVAFYHEKRLVESRSEVSLYLAYLGILAISLAHGNCLAQFLTLLYIWYPSKLQSHSPP
jgi:hypothetical protein